MSSVHFDSGRGRLGNLGVDFFLVLIGHPQKRLEHCFPSHLGEIVNVGGRQAGGADGWEDCFALAVYRPNKTRVINSPFTLIVPASNLIARGDKI